MASTDRSGNKYEQLLEASLKALGYQQDVVSGKNYIRPPVGGQIAIPGTYIQPDLIVCQDEHIKAVLYVTHWSNTRSCKYKFWRTWEEEAQQKLMLGNELLAINCIFEALPSDSLPSLYITSSDLPLDSSRDNQLPIAFKGWYPAVTWAMVESFDISIAFPIGYEPVHNLKSSIISIGDKQTTQLLDQALAQKAKENLKSQWVFLSEVRIQALDKLPELSDTQSRYRIGLLHVYLFYRLIGKILEQNMPPLEDFINALVGGKNAQPQIPYLVTTKAFSIIGKDKLYEIFNLLSKIYVRRKKDAETFCTLSGLTHPDKGASAQRIKFNSDLAVCLLNLKDHINKEGFINAVERSFERFDELYRIDEVFEDLANPALVSQKESFVRINFLESLDDEEKLNQLLQIHAKEMSPSRQNISEHGQNWVFEMLLYLAGLNSAEDIQTRITEAFDTPKHKLRSHAPYGDDAKLVAFMLQGRDVCEQWSSKSRKRTLTPELFRTLSWKAMAKCVVETFQEKGSQIRSSELVIRKYLENKSMRIISSDLNGFYIMIEHHLGNICFLQFTEDAENNKQELNKRLCNSWQTDVVGRLWNGRPLETWMEGVSHNGQWLIKVQSAQDGNEGHKTKELAGRCRALRLAWSHGADPRDRSQWSFSQRPLPKLALVLDGDWDATKKRNLYEAGWDWVGDVSQLHELRQLIQQASNA